MKCSLLIVCAMCSFIFVDSAAAQFHIPGLPGGKKDKNQPQPQSAPDPSQMPQMPPQAQQRQQRNDKDKQAQVKPPGVPVPLDSPMIKAFQQLEQQSAYHMRMTMVSSDPQMAQMMAQMGFSPTETTVAGGTKQVSMHMKIPAVDIPGQVDDWEIRGVSRNGQSARLITSPAVPRILKLGDAALAQQMAQQDRQAAITIAQSLAQGPTGAIGAAILAGTVAVGNVEAVSLRKKAHDFYTWQCMPPAKNQEPVNKNAPPPLTDLRVVGDQMLDGVPVTTYEFYVLDKGEFHGPLRMHVTKDTGLPARIEMSDPRMGGGMRMDYYDFNKGGDIEVPACLADGK